MKGPTQTRFAVRSLKHRLSSQAFLVKPVVSTRVLFHKKAVCPGKCFNDLQKGWRAAIWLLNAVLRRMPAAC